MSRVLSRPMFRRGGSADGITSGLRQGYANGKDVVQGAKDYMNLVETLAPSRGIGAGNEFLMNLGLNLVSNPPSGNILQTLGTEAKEPFQQFQKTRRAETAGRRDLVISYLNSLEDDERVALQKQIDYLVAEFGVSPESALNRLKPEWRKDQSAEETAREMTEVDVKYLTREAPGPDFEPWAARIISGEVNKVIGGDNPDVKAENINTNQPYIEVDDVELAKVDPETGVITLDKIEGDYIDGTMYFNYKTNKWYTHQEGQFLPVNPT